MLYPEQSREPDIGIDSYGTTVALCFIGAALVWALLKANQLENQVAALQASGTGGMNTVSASQPTKQTGLTVDAVGISAGKLVYENASTLSTATYNSTEAKAKVVGISVAAYGANSAVAQIYNSGSQIPLATLVALNAAWTGLDADVYLGANGDPGAAPAQSSGFYTSRVATIVQGTVYFAPDQIPFIA